MKSTAPVTPAQALDRAQALCSRAEMSSHEILTRLERWGINSSDANRIIAQLRDDRYIDDSRFAAAYALDKMRYNHWGRVKIRLMLNTHRIDRDTIDDAISNIDEHEYLALLQQIVERRAATMSHPLGYNDRLKLLRHVASKGFEPQLTIDAIKALNDD